MNISSRVNHWKLAETTKNKMRISKIGNKNPMWKGDDVGYCSLHDWVKRRLEKPEKCQDCNRVPTAKTGLDLANISQKYKRDLSDWEWLCRRCHMTKDGRIKELVKNSIKFPKKQIVHGTLAAYGYRSCRCNPCKNFHSYYFRNKYKNNAKYREKMKRSAREYYIRNVKIKSEKASQYKKLKH